MPVFSPFIFKTGYCPRISHSSILFWGTYAYVSFCSIIGCFTKNLIEEPHANYSIYICQICLVSRNLISWFKTFIIIIKRLLDSGFHKPTLGSKFLNFNLQLLHTQIVSIFVPHEILSIDNTLKLSKFTNVIFQLIKISIYSRGKLIEKIHLALPTFMEIYCWWVELNSPESILI